MAATVATVAMGVSSLALGFWRMAGELVHGMNRELEDFYCHSESMGNLANQIMFFMLCDRWFCPRDKLTSLYSLMFYNVIGYMLLYAKHALSALDASVVRVSEHSNIRHLAMTATKVVLDLTKIVTYLITGVFLCLVFGLEQGLEHFNPSWCYIFLTGTYFILTEPGFQKRTPIVLAWLEWEKLENLETFWSPILLRVLSSLVSLLMIVLVWLASEGGLVVILAASYVNVFLTLRDMDRHLKVLAKERAALSKYRYATRQELSKCDDVCAVCLQTMRSARITPCHHIYHGDCLRQCLKGKPVCPLCKAEL